MKTINFLSMFLLLAGNIFGQQFCDPDLQQKLDEKKASENPQYLIDFEYHLTKSKDSAKYSMVLSENTSYRLQLIESEKYTGKIRCELYNDESLIGSSFDKKAKEYHSSFDVNIEKTKVYHFGILLNEGDAACGYVILYYVGSIQKDSQNEKQQQVNPDQMPEFPGGMEKMTEYFIKNLEYPANAIKNNIQGKVFVKFVITEDGSVTDVKIVRSLDKECDEEAIKVIKAMPKWNPGRKNGKNVSMELTLPVEFKTTK